MGDIRTPNKVKLFVGMLSSKVSWLDEACEVLTEKFGNIDSQTPADPFHFTDYYEDEMGQGLLRKFIAFDRLIDPQTLPGIKICTNQIEAEFSRKYDFPKRPVNLDPGYLCLSKIILATTKDYSHRIYLGDGIYGETTLKYYQKAFIAWEWTYPDYKSPKYLEFFGNLRNIYKMQLPKSGNKPNS